MHIILTLLGSLGLDVLLLVVGFNITLWWVGRRMRRTDSLLRDALVNSSGSQKRDAQKALR